MILKIGEPEDGKMEYTDFITKLNCFALPPKGETKTHSYTVEEDLVAYFCARSTYKNKEKIELLVMKMNRLKKSDLKASSFSMRISNMSFSIYGSGNKHNSEQGKMIAEFLNKEYNNKRMDNVKLANHINTLYGEKIV